MSSRFQSQTRLLADNLICHHSDEGGPPDVTGPITKMHWHRPEHLKAPAALQCGSANCPGGFAPRRCSASIPDLVGMGADQPRPSVLHGVSCISVGPQHATRDRTRRRPLALKSLRQPFRLPRKRVLISHIPSMSFVMVVTHGSHSA